MCREMRKEQKWKGGELLILGLQGSNAFLLLVSRRCPLALQNSLLFQPSQLKWGFYYLQSKKGEKLRVSLSCFTLLALGLEPCLGAVLGTPLREDAPELRLPHPACGLTLALPSCPSSLKVRVPWRLLGICVSRSPHLSLSFFPTCSPKPVWIPGWRPQFRHWQGAATVLPGLNAFSEWPHPLEF